MRTRIPAPPFRVIGDLTIRDTLEVQGGEGGLTRPSGILLVGRQYG
ncbi:MAG: hypothetical protein ACREOC_12005 [Gemmatimonadales bacterium]